LENATPGVREMLIAACDPSAHERLGVTMAELGRDRSEIPQPINLFTNLPVDVDGVHHWLPSRTEAGDDAQLRGEVEAFVATSSCRHDVVPISDKNLPRVAIEVL
jgi:uncharacterized protein YcgI (DUF1989 family)